MGQVKRVQPAQAHSIWTAGVKQKFVISNEWGIRIRQEVDMGVISLEIEMEDTHSKNEAEIGWIQLLSHGV